MCNATPSRLHCASHAKAMISLSGMSSVRRSPLSASVCTLTTCAGKVMASLTAPRKVDGHAGRAVAPFRERRLHSKAGIPPRRDTCPCWLSFGFHHNRNGAILSAPARGNDAIDEIVLRAQRAPG
jgi:hypothetical protein